MAMDLKGMGLGIECEVPIRVFYHGQMIDEGGFRLDILVEDTVIVEVKSVEEIRDVHKKQLLTYLRLAKKPLGLLINFNVSPVTNGITRIVNTKPPKE